MGLQFWRRNGPRSLSQNLKEAIIFQFRCTGAESERLSYFRRKGTFAGRPVTQVRIYDRGLLTGQESELKKYEHLDAECQAILFEGHYEAKGQANLIDRRAPAAVSAD